MDFKPEKSKELEKIAEKNERDYIVDFAELILDRKHWDICFVDYKCYRVFIDYYKEDIDFYINEYQNLADDTISFETASWTLYFMATKQEHRIKTGVVFPVEKAKA